MKVQISLYGSYQMWCYPGWWLCHSTNEGSDFIDFCCTIFRISVPETEDNLCFKTAGIDAEIIYIHIYSSHVLFGIEPLSFGGKNLKQGASGIVPVVR